jgi:serine/threonine-protein kinase
MTARSSQTMVGGFEVTETLPQKIGRYDVLGHLAAGGMAEIFLGRLVGPSGFERPIVIKRILPNLARDREFIEMFLDEARIIAGIRHPNVVQVQELGHDNGELFLAMEYLEGESASGLTRRLCAQHETIDFGLGAYILSEACAGLHAAHELTDAEGKKRNVVHRDVSPQNVFITYSGEVKVLDFGVAIAADRITKTEAGQFKGKFEYASPEQCRGHTLDRRSDIFALGIVLYEVTTGTRLFKRNGSLDMLRAICETPIVPPMELMPGYPPQLNAVVMKALSRKADERYQTALEMRRDLLAVIRAISNDVAPEEGLSALMHRCFAERIALKQEMLRSVQAGRRLDQMPSVETDTTIEIPIAYADGPTLPPQPAPVPAGQPALGEGSLAEIASHITGVTPARKTIGMVPLVAGGVGLVVVLGGVAIGVVMHNSSSREQQQPAPLASTEAPAVVPAPSAAIATPPPTTNAVANEIVLRIDTVPPGAHVIVGGVDRGVSPAEVHVLRASEGLPIEIRKDGYLPLKDNVVPDMDQRLRLTLNAVPRQTTAPAPQPSHKATFGRFD